MHYHNRQTGLSQKGYFDRVYHTFRNGHVQLDSMEIQYGSYDGYEGQRGLSWPGAPLACHKLINIFPGTTFILRAPSFRVDTMTPLGPNKVLIEFRGLGITGESAEDRGIPSLTPRIKLVSPNDLVDRNLRDIDRLSRRMSPYTGIQVAREAVSDCQSGSPITYEPGCQ